MMRRVYLLAAGLGISAAAGLFMLQSTVGHVRDFILPSPKRANGVKTFGIRRGRIAEAGLPLSVGSESC